MRKLTFIGFLCVLLLVSCSQEKYPETSSETNKAGVVFKLQKEDYEGNSSRSSENETSLYDQLYLNSATLL